MTPWTLDAVGRPTFRHGPWTVTQEGGAVGVSHTDTDIDVSVDADELEVFGEGGLMWSTYAIRVRIPLIVLRAILEAQENVAKEKDPDEP